MWTTKRRTPAIRTLVGEGTVVHGNLAFGDGLRIDGEVLGDVEGLGERTLVVVSENARVVGKVTAGHVIINGDVRGPVEARELLELQPRARVTGDVRYELLEMHRGATVEGEIRPLKSADKPALTLAASNDA